MAPQTHYAGLRDFIVNRSGKTTIGPISPVSRFWMPQYYVTCPVDWVGYSKNQVYYAKANQSGNSEAENFSGYSAGWHRKQYSQGWRFTVDPDMIFTALDEYPNFTLVTNNEVGYGLYQDLVTFGYATMSIDCYASFGLAGSYEHPDTILYYGPINKKMSVNVESRINVAYSNINCPMVLKGIGFASAKEKNPATTLCNLTDSFLSTTKLWGDIPVPIGSSANMLNHGMFDNAYIPSVYGGWVPYDSFISGINGFRISGDYSNRVEFDTGLATPIEQSPYPINSNYKFMFLKGGGHCGSAISNYHYSSNSRLYAITDTLPSHNFFKLVTDYYYFDTRQYGPGGLEDLTYLTMVEKINNGELIPFNLHTGTTKCWALVEYSRWETVSGSTITIDATAAFDGDIYVDAGGRISEWNGYAASTYLDINKTKPFVSNRRYYLQELYNDGSRNVIAISNKYTLPILYSRARIYPVEYPPFYSAT